MNRVFSHALAAAAGAALAAAPVAFTSRSSGPTLASINARVSALERFQHACLQPVHLYESPQGWMAWGYGGGPTLHAATFFGQPDTSAGLC